MMPDFVMRRTNAERAATRLHWISTALLLGAGVSGLLWLLDVRYRQVYQPDDNDVTALADGLLLLPDARWEDWFTQGHSHFFDVYPEWPWGLTPFARPAFQSIVYLAHFLFGRDWSSYLTVNYVATAAVATVAFAIARAALGLGIRMSMLVAGLVLLSPAVLEYSIWKLGFASESFATALTGCAFLALLARRDLLGMALLLLAVLTKETAIWAPIAGALTVLLRTGRWETLRHRAVMAAGMVLPLGLWLALRFAFYGGIGGGYATGAYSPLSEFMKLVIWKLVHVHRLFVSQEIYLTTGPWALADRVLMVGTHLLVWLLLIIWGAVMIRSALRRVTGHEGHWPDTTESAFLTGMWAATAFAFNLALTLDQSRYAASVVMFAWPAIAHEVMRRRKAIVTSAVVICFIFSLGRTWHLIAKMNPPSEETASGWYFRHAVAMTAALRDVPPDIKEVYVISAGRLATAAPDYLRVFLGVPVPIIRIADIHSECDDGVPMGIFEHDVSDGRVMITATLPACSTLFFDMAGPGSTALVDGRIGRSDSISYELPEATLIDHKGPLKPALEPGRRMVARIRTHGPARFIIEQGGPGDGLISFETP